MKIVEKFPPNWTQIQLALKIKDKPIFCYGDTIYNPYKEEVTPDRHYHEYIHSEQQEKIGIQNWWEQYLTNTDFRLNQELEAYGEQLIWVKKHVTDRKFIQMMLENYADALSSGTYGNMLEYGEAESKLRNYAKKME